MSDKKQRLINASKQKLNMSKQKPKIFVINFFNNLDEENLIVWILPPILGRNEVDVAIISINIYCLAYKIKKAQFFAILIKNLEFQAVKEARPKTDFKTIVPEKYHNLLYMFSKKKLRYTSFSSKILLLDYIKSKIKT